MMGDDCIFEVRSMYATSDDEVGGAELSGTVTSSYVAGRIESAPVEMQLLLQGIETGQLYNITLDSSTLKIRTNYQVRVSWPKEHFLFGVWLKVINCVHTSAYGSFAHWELLARHVDESHG